MKKRIAVIDACVVVKWLLPEDDQDIAYQLQDEYQDGTLDLIAPELLIPEVGNVLWKRVRRKELSVEQAGILFNGLLRDAPILLNSATAHERAMQLSLHYDRPIYDCEYLALALQHECDLITADRRFHAAVGADFPLVKLLSNVRA